MIDWLKELTIEDILEHTGLSLEEFALDYPELIPPEPAYAPYK